MTGQTIQGARGARRVVAALMLIAESEAGLSLTEIARLIDIPVSSAHALLRDLVACGAVTRVDGGRFVAGQTLIALGARVLGRQDLLRCAVPVMESLAAALEEDVYLAVVGNGDHLIYEYRCMGAHSSLARVQIPLGVPRPLYAGAAGQAYLASLDVASRTRIVQGLELRAITPATITDKDRLLEKLAVIEAQGFAETHGEGIEGVVAVAAAVHQMRPNGSLPTAGAISVSMLTGRFPGREDMVRSAVKDACVRISRCLGAT